MKRLLLLGGGGIIPPALGVLAGLVGTQIDRPLTRWGGLLSGRAGALLARLWPWPAIVYPTWILALILLRSVVAGSMQGLGVVPTLLTNILLLLTILSGLAADYQTWNAKAISS